MRRLWYTDELHVYYPKSYSYLILVILFWFDQQSFIVNVAFRLIKFQNCLYQIYISNHENVKIYFSSKYSVFDSNVCACSLMLPIRSPKSKSLSTPTTERHSPRPPNTILHILIISRTHMHYLITPLIIANA